MAEMADEDVIFSALQALNEFPVEGELKDFRVRTNTFEFSSKANSSYEAALRTACIITEFKIKSPCVLVEALDSTRTTFEYEVKNGLYRGHLFPRVVLIKKCVCGDYSDATERTTSYFGSRQSRQSTSSDNFADESDQPTPSFDIDSILGDVFGHESFKPLQRETIVKTLVAKVVLSIMGTGGGKSLTFMLPAAVSSKLTIVISPIRSLIEDLLRRSRS